VRYHSSWLEQGLPSSNISDRKTNCKDISRRHSEQNVGRSEDYGESVKGELVAVGQHRHQQFLFPAGVFGDFGQFGQFGDFLNRQQRQQPITYSSSPPKIVPLSTDEEKK